ncbi:MAG: zinc ribbon domain-containing protein [Fluviicola sp.]
MLNFLSPPTDSFYKFMGIGGLLIFITCGFFLFFGMYKDDYKLVLAQGELTMEELRLQTIVNDLEYSPHYKDLKNVNIPKLKAWANHITDPSYSHDSLLVESYYSLPDSIRKEMQSLLFSRLKKQFAYNAVNQEIDGKKSTWYIVFGCCIIGEVFGCFGIWLWYEKLQKPLNDEKKNLEAQKRFTGTELSTDCQSCYMTFYFNTERGTEKDGAISRFFCKACYEEGKYIEHELTFDEAKKRLTTKLQELNYTNRNIQKIEKNFAKLLRWERLRTW